VDLLKKFSPQGSHCGSQQPCLAVDMPLTEERGRGGMEGETDRRSRGDQRG